MTGKRIVDIFAFLFEWGAFLYYAKNLFDARFGKAVQYAVSFGGYALLLVFHQSRNPYINFISIFLVSLMLFFFVFGAKIKIAVLHSAIIPICLMLSDYITVILYSTVFNINYKIIEKHLMTYVVETIVSKLLYFIFLVILVKVFSKSDSIKNQNYLPILIVPLSNVFIMLVFQQVIYQIDVSATMFYLWLAAIILMSIASVFLFVNYHLVFKSADEISSLKIEAQQNKIDKLSMDLVNKANEDMRVLSHDFKNHLIQIDNAENMEQVHEYIKKLYPSIESFNAVKVSANKNLNLIISKYISICAMKGISFEYTVDNAMLQYIEITDLSAILNNIIDNAVEAAEQSKEKMIRLFIFNKNEKMDVIMLENSADAAPVVNREEIVTSKKDKQSHGIGLKSVRKVIYKYNGFYEWEYLEDKALFRTVISFYHE